MMKYKSMIIIILLVWGLLVFYIATALQEVYLQQSGGYEAYKAESAEISQ